MCRGIRPPVFDVQPQLWCQRPVCSNNRFSPDKPDFAITAVLLNISSTGLPELVMSLSVSFSDVFTFPVP